MSTQAVLICGSPGEHISKACDHAVVARAETPERTDVFLMFNGTVIPVRANDDATTLMDRWFEWGEKGWGGA